MSRAPPGSSICLLCSSKQSFRNQKSQALRRWTAANPEYSRIGFRDRVSVSEWQLEKPTNSSPSIPRSPIEKLWQANNADPQRAGTQIVPYQGGRQRNMKNGMGLGRTMDSIQHPTINVNVRSKKEAFGRILQGHQVMPPEVLTRLNHIAH